jgi:N-acetylglucosaminyldiphosphoundecaprenol N-acetyl-beta-D-mannosaminyltransferase
MQTCKLFGFDFISAAHVSEVVEDVVHVISSSNIVQHIVTPNAYVLQELNKKGKASLLQFAQSAKWVLPDGMPIVWLSKLKYKHALKARLTGSDLFPVLWARIKQEHLAATFILPNTQLANLFCQEYPACNVCTPAFFDPTDEAYIKFLAQDVCQLLTAQNSQFLFVGLGDPKQSLIGIQVAQLYEKQHPGKPLVIAYLGASFEFYHGYKSRAPQWITQLGLEWLYRFYKEPKRLWKRYTVGNIRFLSLAFKELFKK